MLSMSSTSRSRISATTSSKYSISSGFSSGCDDTVVVLELIKMQGVMLVLLAEDADLAVKHEAAIA